MADKKEKFWMSLLSDGGKISSKRLITLLSFLLIALGFLGNLFWDFTIEEFIYSSVMYIVIAGLGIVGAEKFAPKKKKSDEDTDHSQEL